MGQVYQPTKSDVEETIVNALSFLKDDSKYAEIAFFGGSFTAIDRDYMISLLDATVPYIDKFKGIRISTRPDCIDEEILSLLKSYKVTSIELGAQSMDDNVLLCNKRGHSSADVYNASELIKSYGISLGLQMMTGLYMSDDDVDIKTAEAFIKIKPDTVRIYPTIVMKNTDLALLIENGRYIPQTLQNAVSLCSKLITMFEDNDINVIRVGLHHSESLECDMISGPYHPSFKELCESEILYNKLVNKIKDKGICDTDELYVKVSPSCVSKIIGNKRSNIKRLEESGYKIKVIQDKDVPVMDVVLDVQRG